MVLKMGYQFLRSGNKRSKWETGGFWETQIHDSTKLIQYMNVSCLENVTFLACICQLAASHSEQQCALNGRSRPFLQKI